MEAKQTPPCFKAFELRLDHVCDLKSRVCLRETHTMSMSEEPHILNIILEVLLVPLPRTYLGVEQQSCRNWHAEYEAHCPRETGK